MPYRIYKISGMTCAACVQNVSMLLKQVDGVSNAEVNLVNNTARVWSDAEIALPLMHDALSDYGYDIFIINKYQEEKKNTGLMATITALVCSAVVMIAAMFFMHEVWSPWVQLLFTLPVIIIGRSFFVRAFRWAKKGKSNMDTLVALGTGTAFVYSISLFISGMIRGETTQHQSYFLKRHR
jgi:P-type Cu2+ transporter